MVFLPGTTGRRRIYLMRHGHVDYFSKEVVDSKDPRLARLTPQGIAQAQAAGEALSDIGFDIAISSGLRRTRETAEHVLNRQNVSAAQLEHDPRLEELHSGQYIEFESREQLAATMTFQFENAHEPNASFFDGGERFDVALERSVEAIRDLLSRPNWATALVVAHEGINRILLSWMCHADLNASASFEQDTGCINILDFDLIPDGDSNKIERRIIKSINLTPENYLKHGMNLRSLEAIFHRED
ncbi:histidine phosphatase family protein [Ponticaulis profundi]|uniref:Histidine phosphatase family protein n=1 Tax=Ponticaulis profundi TaxID=2665222 RepID=A0ABW1SEB2_9PROT